MTQRRRHRAKLEAMTLYVQRPLVIAIAIGQYDDNPKEESVEDIGGYLQDLNGIDNDIRNTVKLFGDTLHFDIFPEYDINNYIKQRWTFQEIMDLFDKFFQFEPKRIDINDIKKHSWMK